MAEKKVGGKKTVKNDREQKTVTEEERIYKDFLDKHGSDLRRRTTKSVDKPKSREDKEKPTTNCGEIDPHTTVNPTIQRQIITKRMGKASTDDSGFKAMSYNERFELQPEMPAIRIDDDAVITEDMGDRVPGQQTMADLASANSETEINAPIESEIEQEDPFTAAYNALKKEGSDMGKSEKLRAIARTAADDAEMEPESQLSFPAFDPLFKFPEEPEETGKKKKQKQKAEKKDKPGKKQKKEKDKKREEKPEPEFDIEETEIVTGRTEPEETEPEQPTEEPENKEKEEKRRRIFTLLKENGDEVRNEPEFEITGRSEMKQAVTKTAASRKKAMFRSVVTAVLGILLLLINLMFSSLNENPRIYIFICLIFLAAAVVISAKDIASGFKDIKRRSLTAGSGSIVMIGASLVQSIGAFIIGDTSGSCILMPVTILSLLALTLPGVFANDNILTVMKTMTKNDPVTVFRPANDSGIEGSLKEKFTEKADDEGENKEPDGDVRFNEKTSFLSGLMRAFTAPLPKAPGMSATGIFAIFFAVVVGIGSGIINGNIMAGLSAFSAMVIACLPVVYALCAVFILLNINTTLKSDGASLISFEKAANLGNTKAVMFTSSDITEKSACSIHGIKTFGSIDPKITTLCAASLMNACDSPFTVFMKQVTDQSGEEVPESENITIVQGKGVTGQLGNRKLFLGTKEFMEENRISVPENVNEDQAISGDRKLLYFAIDREFSMLFVVSYHIKRSVITFFKYLEKKGVRIVINSTDPNMDVPYIAKKCKLRPSSVSEPDETVAAYMRDKSGKCEPSAEANVFTDGRISSVYELFIKADSLTKAVSVIPYIICAFSVIAAFLTALPALTASSFTINNFYILLIRVIGTVLSVLIPLFIAKRN